MANVVSYFGTDSGDTATYGKLKIRGFVSNSINFEYTDDDCISMEINNGSSEDDTVSSDNDWIMNGVNMYNANSGNVGIGTSSPIYKLDIEDESDDDLNAIRIKVSDYTAYHQVKTTGYHLGHSSGYRPLTLDLENVPRLTINDKGNVDDAFGTVTIHQLSGTGNRNLLVNERGTLIAGSSADGGDDDWTRSGSALVPKNSDDYVGIGKSARGGSSNYGLYVNDGTSKKAAAFYTDREDFTVIIRNIKQHQNADGLRIDLLGESEQALVTSTNSTFNQNSRFIDFNYGHGNSSYVNTGSIRIKKNNNCHLTNSSDSRLKANQRPIEYTLDDISSLNLKTFEWKRQKHNYQFKKDIDISSEKCYCR